MEHVGKTTCGSLGEIESAARELIIFWTGMPTERIVLDVKRL
ncbi:hypothetical protein AB0B92_13685 [Streptomyces hygroscopicus]